MNQRVASSQAGGAIRLDRAGALLRRLAPAFLAFAAAFAVDMATGQQYSSVWGSIAIVISVVTVLPVVRPALAALGAYAGVWVGFNVVRAFADDVSLALAGRETAAGWERAIFGALPSAWLQDRLFDPDRARGADIVLSVVHLSFFVTPFTVAALLWWKRRGLFRRYTVATAVTFTLGVIGFVLLPTAPPWLAEPREVTRITHDLLTGSAGASLSRADGGSGLWFEPNQLAALPSIHVAATVLMLLAASRVGRPAAIMAGVYVLLMTFAVVYLGEHYVLDAALGWAVALAGWWLAGRILQGGDSLATPRRRWKAESRVPSIRSAIRPDRRAVP